MIHFQIRNFVFIFLLCDAASAVFQPADRAALKSAVDACLQSDDTGITCVKDGYNISKWDTSNVEDMSSMFHGAQKFNADLSNWNVAKVTNMSSMFYGASNFNSMAVLYVQRCHRRFYQAPLKVLSASQKTRFS